MAEQCLSLPLSPLCHSDKLLTSVKDKLHGSTLLDSATATVGFPVKAKCACVRAYVYSFSIGVFVSLTVKVCEVQLL